MPTICKAAFLGAFAYVGVYGFLSAAGDYQPSRNNQDEWQPYFGDATYVGESTFLGFVFAPLILVDHTLLHPPRATNPEDARRFWNEHHERSGTNPFSVTDPDE